MDAIEFPAEVKDDIAAMRSIWVRLRDLFLTVVDEPSLDIWDDFAEAAAEYGAHADVVRAALGLPPRPTPAG